MNKLVIILIGLALIVSCGGKSDNTSKNTLNVMVQYTEDLVEFKVIEEIIDAFQAENPDITVEYSAGGTGYESLMKAKMATNQLPDIWTTHGWASRRYSEYLLDLKDQEWTKDLHPSIRPVITGANGEIWALPLNVDISGIVYNKDVIAKAGINVDNIKTWDDLLASMQLLKDLGYIPTTMGCKNDAAIGEYYDWIAPAAFIMGDNNEKDKILNGTFNKDKWLQISNILKNMIDKGYLNKDAVTSEYMDTARALAEGKTAYVFLGNYVSTEALMLNPKANLGFFPIPTMNNDAEPYLISGEKISLGVWKDSPNKENALKLLAFMARPENIAKVATATIAPAGLTTAISDTGVLKSDYNKYQNSPVTGFFDREYMPNGMWDTMIITGIGIISGSMTPEVATNEIANKFSQLYGQ